MAAQSSKDALGERRWLVLAQDGRHVWLGRWTDPSPEELASAEAALIQQAGGGWLAVGCGSYYAPGEMTLLEVRPLGRPLVEWPQAVASFHAHRFTANKSR